MAELHIIEIERNHVSYILDALDADRDHLETIVDDQLADVEAGGCWVVPGINGSIRAIGGKDHIIYTIDVVRELTDDLRDWTGGRVMMTEDELLNLYSALGSTSIAPTSVEETVCRTIDDELPEFEPNTSDFDVDIAVGE